MTERLMVNGKHYPMWSQFIEQKERWIGGRLQSWEDGGHYETTITDIRLEPNGDESAYFKIDGQDFGCGFDVRHGGIDPTNRAKNGKGITLSVRYVGTFCIEEHD